MNQIELHNKIREVIAAGPGATTPVEVSELIVADRHYFYAKANENWLEWLWKNKFLKVFENKVDPSNNESYKLPELFYLRDVAEKSPEIITEIILGTKLSEENFNPNVIDQFLWICSNSLPAEQIVKLADKIKDENWVKKMQKYNSWGFDYEKIFEKLIAVKEFKAFLTLAEAVLLVINKDELVSESDGIIRSDRQFYYRDLYQTRIFSFLSQIDDNNLEGALDLLLGVLKKITENGEKSDSVFEYNEPFYIGDESVFSVEIEEKHGFSYHDDIKNLVATIRILLGRLPQENITEYFGKIQSLPFSRTSWRLQLFFAVSYKDVLGGELEKMLLRLFEEDCYPHLFWGAEYKEALQKGFGVVVDKEAFINKAFDLFDISAIKDENEIKMRKRDALIIFSCIPELSEENKGKAEEMFGVKIDPDYKPQPSIGKITTHWIQNKAPIGADEFNKLSIDEIIEKLKTNLSVKELFKNDRGDDFEPNNSEGVGMILRSDISKRPDAYLAEVEKFSQLADDDKTYFYYLFQGISDLFRENKYVPGVAIDSLLILVEKILERDIGDGGVAGRNRDFGWLANWDEIYKSIAETIKGLLNEENSGFIDFVKNRDKFVKAISKLLDYQFDPNIEDNIRENGDHPYGIAINSVRGVGFECLINFVYLDGKGLEKEVKKIKNDSFELYIKLVEAEKTFAIRFMIGKYLSSFFYRDKEETLKLLPQIFPDVTSDDGERYDLCLASLEGFLSANLYGEMFQEEEFKSVYKKAIGLDSTTFTKRKYFKEIDDGLADHLALAYIYFSDFDENSELFKLFWAGSNLKAQKEFISFIGRHMISRDNANEVALANDIDLKKIAKFWDWILNEADIKSEVFAGFGFWMNKESKMLGDYGWLAKNIFKTLERGGGLLDWDYGLTKVLSELAENEPATTLDILKAYLLPNAVSQRAFIYIEDYVKAFEIVHIKLGTSRKADIENLISDLMKAGGQTFWRLENIIK